MTSACDADVLLGCHLLAEEHLQKACSAAGAPMPWTSERPFWDGRVLKGNPKLEGDLLGDPAGDPCRQQSPAGV